jgi:NSS family neurotransmitter:Na+ symporter
LGFILAATGSAVGLGNIWGFPTNTAENGGAAFLLVYLILAFCLAYPALMAELIIGRHCRANIVSALGELPLSRPGRKLGTAAGIVGVLTASAILGFYSLVAGWMVAQFVAQGAAVTGAEDFANWFGRQSLARDMGCALVFAVLTIAMVSEGVKEGIERWSTRLMPLLIFLLLALIAYVMFQPGALLGLKVYLLPDISAVFDGELIVSALGQAFFSLSLGVGTMLIYGSYIPREENLPALGAAVTLIDMGIAFLAGLLILPALFVAQQQGIDIYQNGELIAGPNLILQVLPTLFDSMGAAGIVFALIFFALLTIAALTSSISMLEVPTSLLVESTPLERRSAAWLSGGLIFILTAVILIWFDPLFGLVVTATTEYSEPLLGIVLCLFAGWAIHRDQLLEELRHGNPQIEDSYFWKIWPLYVRFFCPLLIAATFIQSLR